MLKSVKSQINHFAYLVGNSVNSQLCNHKIWNQVMNQVVDRVRNVIISREPYRD